MPGMIPDCYYKEDKEMAFEQKTWTNRIAEFINRRVLTKEDGTTELVTVARSEGQISQEGDAFNADNMNDLEQRIAEEFTVQNETFSKQISELNTNLATKANASDLSTKASNADLNAEKNTRASVDASLQNRITAIEKVDTNLQNQINDAKAVKSYPIETWTVNVTSTESICFIGCGRIAMFSGAILGTFPALTVITLGKLSVAPIATKYGVCKADIDDSVSATGHFTIDTNGVINVYINGSGTYERIVMDAAFMI